METKYLIIGNAAGGIGAIEGIRSVDKSGAVTVVSSEPYAAYSRPLIAEYLSGERDFDGMRYRPAEFYEKNKVTTLFGNGVSKIDIGQHAAILADGQKITFEKLLIATGGAPIMPKTPGMEAKGVFNFINLDDAKKIKNYIAGRQISAVVIGGGLIGLSVSEALKKNGVKVTVVELKDYILNTILDAEAGAFAASAVKKAGVNIMTGRTVVKIESGTDGAVTGVTLDNGSSVGCEMVVFAIGVRPNADVATGTGIKVNRGILVDRHMATNIEGIYACGDVAEAYDFISEAARLTPIWPNAYIGGRTAGLNMAGKTVQYPGGTAMNSLKYFGMEIVTAGLVTSPAPGYEAMSGAGPATFRKIILKNGIIAGMVYIGNIEKAGIVFSFMKDRVNVGNFKKLLVSDDLNMASLPESIYRSKLTPPVTVS
jgi:NAD(P)H-nitrite reductase large subunit